MEIVDAGVTLRRPSDRITFLPAGCIHYDDPNSDHELFSEYLKKANTTPNAFVIGLGDWRDFARAHFRGHILGYTRDETSLDKFDLKIRREIEDFAKMFRHISDRKAIIGLLEGNHFWKFQDGTTDTQYLCQLLGCKYLGLSAFIRFHVEYEKCSSKHVILFLAHHGVGTGGKYMSTDLGQLERNIEPAFDADVYLSSHTHKKFAVAVSSLTVNRRGRPKLIQRTKLLVKTGAFLRGYCVGKQTYAEQKLFRPTDLGWVNIYAVRKEHGDDSSMVLSHEY